MELTKTFECLSPKGGKVELEITVDFDKHEGVRDILSVVYTRITPSGSRQQHNLSAVLLDEAEMLGKYWQEENWLEEYHDEYEGPQLDDES